MSFELKTILDILGGDALQTAGRLDRQVTIAAPIHEAVDAGAFSYVSAGRADALDLMRGTKAGLVLVAPDVQLDAVGESDKTFIVVENPRLSFLRIIRALYPAKKQVGIHPTAFVEPGAKLGKDVYIGPFSYIGECEIGDETVIHGHVHIYSNNVKIGSRCTIYASTVIGNDGSGYARNAQGELELFPSIGGVVIGDDVDIHTQCQVDRGTLGDTVIGSGTKIDNYAYISHNVKIGKHCLILGQTILSGGAVVGDYVTIGVDVSVRDRGLHIGDRAFIGMSSLVTKDVPPGETWVGSPARPIDDYNRLLAAMKQMAAPALPDEAQ